MGRLIRHPATTNSKEFDPALQDLATAMSELGNTRWPSTSTSSFAGERAGFG